MLNEQLNQTIIAYLTIILAVFTWSLVEIIVKFVQNAVGPIALSFFRYFIGGLFLLIILIIKRDLSGIIKMIRNNWKVFLLISIIASGLSNILYFIGVNNTQANIASAILTTYPIWITIFSFFLLKEKSNIEYKIIGIILGVIGVFILITNFNFSGFLMQENLLGNILVLCGSIIWGLYTPLGKRIQTNEEETTNCALKFTMLSFVFTSIFISFIVLLTPEVHTFFQYDLNSWFWVLFLGIIPTGFGQYIFFLGVKHIEVSKGISLAFLKPVFATILAFFILQEQTTFTLLISIGLVSCSVILINRNRNNAEIEEFNKIKP
ncbi:MAG: membrane protein of unknown function [Promethearchaeota archaeon]|nr:MAG: membrane protein of unknown function [Candidatus Lokiarchaeota archaeon]